VNVLVDIPARGGSKGIPRKNLRTLLGISLVGWAVLAARRSRALLGTGASLRILVDTDDEEIAREGRAWGAEVPFLRPAELARDETPTAGSVVHALGRYRESGWAADGLLLLQPTSPLRSAEDVIACAAPFLAGRAESVVSVTPLEHPLELAYRSGEAGVLTQVMPAAGAVRRQDGTGAVFPSGAVYLISAALLSSSERFIHSGATLGIELPRSRSLDIDTEADLALAESVARGEALAARPEAGEAVGRWHEVDLGSLSAGLVGLEEAVRAGGTEGLLVTGPRGWPPERIFDGVAACRRATGLPVVVATS